MVPVLTGDLSLSVVGTVTEVTDNKVYGFGHSFLGYGPVDMPMAEGTIHTVVSSVARSFKVGSPGRIAGALRVDEAAAVVGNRDANASMIPLTIKLDRYNMTGPNTFKCSMVDNSTLTPVITQIAISGAGTIEGSLPPDHKIRYSGKIDIEGYQPLSFENVSTESGFRDVLMEAIGSVGVLMNNPYKEVKLEGLEFSLNITRENIRGQIWSVNLSDSTVKPAQTVEVEVVVESWLGEKNSYNFKLDIPENLNPGKYKIRVLGGSRYQNFLQQQAPQRFLSENMSTLIEAMNASLNIKRNRLHCLLELGPDGIAIERAELPSLPATRAMVLQDEKRVLRTRPYFRWIEKSKEIPEIINEQQVLEITVEE